MRRRENTRGRGLKASNAADAGDDNFAVSDAL